MSVVKSPRAPMGDGMGAGSSHSRRMPADVFPNPTSRTFREAQVAKKIAGVKGRDDRSSLRQASQQCSAIEMIGNARGRSGSGRVSEAP